MTWFNNCQSNEIFEVLACGFPEGYYIPETLESILGSILPRGQGTGSPIMSHHWGPQTMAPNIQCMSGVVYPVAPCLSLSLERSRRPMQTSINSDRSPLILDLGTGIDKSWRGTRGSPAVLLTPTPQKCRPSAQALLCVDSFDSS